MKKVYRKKVFAYFFSAFLIINAFHSTHAKVVFSKTDGPRNFGILMNNSDYTIYRSSRLGKLGLQKVWSYLEENNLPLPKTVIYMNANGYKRRFPFYTLFALEEFKLQDKYNITFYHPYDYENRTYVDGRNPFKPQRNIDNKKYLNNEAMELFNFKEDNIPDGGLDNFIRVLELVLDKKNSPVLFHCSGGMHRSGMVAMAIRYLQGGEWVSGKKEVFIMPKMKKLVLNLAQYEYALHNRYLFRQENIDFIEKFAEHSEFKRLKDLYGEELKRAGDVVKGIYSQNTSEDAINENNKDEKMTIQMN